MFSIQQSLTEVEVCGPKDQRSSPVLGGGEGEEEEELRGEECVISDEDCDADLELGGNCFRIEEIDWDRNNFLMIEGVTFPHRRTRRFEVVRPVIICLNHFRRQWCKIVVVQPYIRGWMSPYLFVSIPSPVFSVSNFKKKKQREEKKRKIETPTRRRPHVELCSAS